MTREIRLGDLTPREKDNTILVQQGALKDLRRRLEALAEISHRARRELDDWERTYAPRLGFLGRIYTRTVVEPGQLQRAAAKNDRRWAELTTAEVECGNPAD